jgi:predicted ATPase
MTVQLQKLPIDTQSILKLAACIGDRFEIHTLAIVSKQVSSEIEASLWQALAESLILPVADSGKFSIESNPHSTAYKFSHDRVQQAAYELIPATQKQSTHLEIGRLLLSNTLEIDLESQIFIILNHLNIGRSLITQPVEQNRLVQLNLIAAQKAKVSTAYTAASQHLEICIELLPADSWQTQIELTRSIYELAAKAAYLSANYPEMARLVAIFIAHTDNLIDKIRMCEIQMLGAKAQGQLQASIEIGLQSLQLLGVEFPATPTPANIHAALGSTLAAWQDLSIASLEDLPLRSDRADLAAMRIITQMTAMLGSICADESSPSSTFN